MLLIVNDVHSRNSVCPNDVQRDNSAQVYQYISVKLGFSDFFSLFLERYQFQFNWEKISNFS